ncbi:calcium-binding protein [Nonomuraea zeae]|uniref:Calcium-binding protein n=1 Tax=Nonomuraea zeae TaxID=1642303 RepID=A0A5S4G0R7_9ACTN|nr:hypothetical protein [Nonomuraea zeae]TMR26556.1 hypothetical protein ETD85_42120 [Nonomuraea zeae]
MRNHSGTPVTGRGSMGAVLRRHGVRALTAAAALAATLLAVAGPAHATTNVSVSGGALQISSGAAADDIAVFVDTDGSLIIRNTADTVVASAPCVGLTANEVDCPSAGITAVTVNTGAGDDSFRNRTSLRTKAFMGTGADLFFGGLSRDIASGDDGNDRLAGLAGDDLLIGGAGADTANGADGTDTCDAEIESNCES